MTVVGEPGKRVGVSGRSGWLVWVLAAITVGCLAAAAVVFAMYWRWGPPPRVDMIAVPPPPPRQQEALTVVQKWYDAENHSDAAGMRAVACAHPSESVSGWIDTIEHFGEDQSLIFPDAVIGFRDEGARVWAKVASRARPLNEQQRQAVAQEQTHGGFFTDEFTLADEDGRLTVCDMKYEPGP